MITIDPNAGVTAAQPWQWCRVCGAPPAQWMRERPDWSRCRKHLRSNPCAIEGCKRSTAAPENGRLALDAWFCGTHWKQFTPPRSARRRAYHAFFRKAKRDGWSDELLERFHRFWNQLVASARARHAGRADGHLDIAEIERMFGL